MCHFFGIFARYLKYSVLIRTQTQDNKQTIYEISKVLEDNNYETRDSLDTKGEIYV